MKKHPVLKVLIILLVIIILIPCIYIAYDRSQMPPPPPWTSPPFNPKGTWEQMANDYSSAHPDNALKNYLNAFSLYTMDLKIMLSSDSILRNGWSNDYPGIDRLLELNQGALHEVMLGAEKKNCELPPTPYDFAAQVPNFLRIQTLSKLLAVQGKKLEYQKQPGNALKIYLDGMQFGKDIGQKDQSLIGKLISVAAMSIHIKPIQHLISQNVLSGREYVNIIDELGRIDREKCTINDMIEIEDRITYTSLYKLSNDPKAFKEIFGTTPSGGTGIDGIALYFLFNKGKVLRNRLNMDNELLSIASTNTYGEFAQTDWNGKIMKMDMINKLSVPSFNQAYTRLLVLTSKIRLAQIQAAIHLYNLKNKKPLTDLKNLVPDYIAEVPLDPFTNQSFLLEKGDSREPFAYSTGPDFKDDNTQMNYDPTNGTMSTGDIRP